MFALLAAFPGSFLAAYGVLVTSLQIRADDTLLVHGGSSAVGMAVASLAKRLYGVRKVIGTTRSAHKLNE
jgi:NADPH2:quinone reductase